MFSKKKKRSSPKFGLLFLAVPHHHLSKFPDFAQIFHIAARKTMVLPKYFLLTARKILIFPKSSKLGGAIAPPAPPAGTAMYWNKPYSTFENQIELIRKLGVFVKENYVNRTMCTKSIHNIASSIRKKFMEDILISPCASLLLDGSTDISVSASVIVYMRYITEGTIVELFVGVVEPPNKTADGYITDLNSLSKRLRINLFNKGKMVGLATDGARTMLGCQGSVAAKLTKDIPHLIVIHCVAHRLQLAVLDSLNAVPFMQKVEKTLRGLYIHILSFFTKALVTQKEVAATLEMQLLKLKDINAVRWVACKKQALQTFLKSWQAVVFQMQKNSNVGTSDTQKAKVLLRAICDFRFLNCCHFLYDFLSILRPLSATFQRENLMLTEIKPSVNHSISLLSHLEKKPGRNGEYFFV